MLAKVQRALELAEKLGAEEAEAFASDNLAVTIRIASNRIVETKQVQDSGIGLCAAIKKKIGFSSDNELTQELVRRSISIARARPPNPKFNGFPSPRKASKVADIYDPNLAAISRSRIVELAEEMLQAALDFDNRIIEASGAINLVVERCAVANTNGVQAVDATTKIFGHLTAESQGLERGEGQGWMGSNALKNFRPTLIGEEAAEFAIKSLMARRVQPGSYDVVLEPNAAAELLYHVLSYAINGKDAYEKISYFSSRLGQTVASESLNVADWGNMPSGLYSKTIDDEGSPTQKTSLIEKGKLIGFIYDWYYGGLAGRKSTGNGFRLGDFGRSYQLSPTPYISNLVVQPGKSELEELMEDIRTGLLLSRIWYTYPITPQVGDFSTTSRCGFLISRGEVNGAIKQVRIHENLPRLLKRLDGIGKEARQIIPWGASAAVCTPALKFRGVRVS
ncbi:MAG: TldD/PmbA family protein [Candidatus Hadarchaeum sp.]|uniref:TldD/PmbA family protein n=1 Tax=Candidatus Hadarchaeum sp. TaxID=2883567 RepID=UPI003D09BFCB